MTQKETIAKMKADASEAVAKAIDYTFVIIEAHLPRCFERKEAINKLKQCLKYCDIVMEKDWMKICPERIKAEVEENEATEG